MTISPNPADNKLNIALKTFEKGWHQLSIMNLQGSTNVLGRWYIEDSDEFEIIADLGNYSSGVYYILLQSPSTVKTEVLFIIK